MKKTKILGDLTGGVLGAVIALPQALAFGVAIGVGAASGLWGAVILCFTVGVFGCNQPLLSGPTGPAAIVTASALATLGGKSEALFAVIFLAGIFQIIISRTKLIDIVKYIPYPVISGFMNAVGTILIILQLSPFFGNKSFATPLLALKNLSYSMLNINENAFTIGLLALAIIFWTPKKITNIIPSQILALIITTLAAVLYGLELPTVQGVSAHLPNIIWADFSNLKMLIIPALIIAIVCSSESLLTNLVVDSLTKTNCNSNKMVLSQGIGNIICSLFGAICGSGATMRSAAAIKAGGTTRFCSIFCAIILLLIILFASDFANKIPLSALAAVLFKVGLDIVDTKLLKVIKYAPKQDLFVMLTVFLLTIFYDIIIAVSTGIVLSALIFAKQLADKTNVKFKDIEDKHTIELEKKLQDETGYKIRVVHILGEFFFGSATQIISHFEEILGTKFLIICYESENTFDISAIFALEDIITRLKSQEIIPHLVIKNSQIFEQLEKLNIADQIGKENIFCDEEEAINHAKNLLKLEAIKKRN